MTTPPTLKDFLQSPDPTIKRHALGIQKRLEGGYYRLTSCIECKQRIEQYTKTLKEKVICETCGLAQ